MIEVIFIAVLVAYAVLTLPLMFAGLMRAYQARPKKESGNIKIVDLKLDMKPFVDDMQSEAMLTRHFLNDKFEHLETDIKALMNVTANVGHTMLEIRDAASEYKGAATKERGLEDYVASLLYARDKYATTATQRKAMDSIISSIRQSDGKRK